ncbi:MAG: 23S rRNA (adenine(1618)-N(6))-methyltransferase RlmF, partial [Flavobacteriales bacterium]|nr:23S rRNA (adenine(1618)-N(6))-methyltransferase RlmF [Flavobacteriales bacterium]
PEAVKMLNTALLKHFYEITYWAIPENYLCPPIPGRADYIHHVAQLLGENNYGNIPTGSAIKCLDVGVGANCIYPIVGNKEYGWSFIGTDIDAIALDNGKQIVKQNPSLKDVIEFRLQENPKDFFYGVITKEEQIDVTVCNPPFHSSAEEAFASTQRKIKNLKGKREEQPVKNFGGKNTELWCDGGENKFVRNMIRESKKFAKSCYWFTSLVSKQSNLKSVYRALENEAAEKVVTIPMGQGNKSSRIVAWTFLNVEEQKNWRESHWK